MAFTKAVAGNSILITDLNQIIEAWEGDAGKGQPLNLTAVNDAVNYALDVRNLDPTNSYGLRVRNASGEDLLRTDKSNVILGKPMTVASGVTVGGVNLASHVHTGEAGMGPILTHASIQDRTRRVFIPYVGAKDQVANAALAREHAYGYPLPPNKQSAAWANFWTPTGFLSGAVIYFVVIGAVDGNMCWQYSAYFGGAGENAATHTQSYVASATAALTQNVVTVLGALALGGMSAGDFCSVTFYRYGQEEPDTCESSVYAPGILLDYTADM